MYGTSEFSNSRLSEIINDENYFLAITKMMDLVVSFKQDFQLESIFNEVLAERNLELTPGAQLVLIIPIIEAAFAQSERERMNTHNPNLDTNLNTVQDSIEQIVEYATNSPAPADRERQLFSSLSIIKAFWHRFCDIPPFCGKTD